MGRPIKPIGLREREFWDRVDRGGADECWLWKGAVNVKGYGRYRMDGKNLNAHRFAFIVTFGKRALGPVIRHKCDNPPCCNPKHLLAGNNKENLMDMLERGPSSFRPDDWTRGRIMELSRKADVSPREVLRRAIAAYAK